MPIKSNNIPPESSLVMNAGEYNSMDKFFFNSQDSFGCIDTSELFKESLEEHVIEEIMKNTVSSEPEELINENRTISIALTEITNEPELVDEVNKIVYPPTGTIPCTEDYTGPFGFELHLTSGTHNRGSYVYSPLLKQVFISTNNVLMMEFKTTQVPEPGFYIRALLMYTCDDFVCEPVIRCASHALEDDPRQEAHARNEEHICRCANFNFVGHVMRCSLSDAEYCYDCESARHSVRVPVKRLQAGTEFIQIPYSFACKTSCPRGMQRKPVQIVFTLETEDGHVCGRKVLAIKISSCPKRDKDRQERDFKKAQVQSCPPSGSKRLPAAAPLNVTEPTQPPLKAIKLEEQNYEDSQTEEDRPKHRKQVVNNSHSIPADIEQFQRLLITKFTNLENTLENIRKEHKEGMDKLEGLLYDVLQSRN